MLKICFFITPLPHTHTHCTLRFNLKFYRRYFRGSCSCLQIFDEFFSGGITVKCVATNYCPLEEKILSGSHPCSC